MRAIYDCIDEPHEFPEERQDLFSRLATEVTDDFERKRSKKGSVQTEGIGKKEKEDQATGSPENDERRTRKVRANRQQYRCMKTLHGVGLCPWT